MHLLVRREGELLTGKSQHICDRENLSCSAIRERHERGRKRNLMAGKGGLSGGQWGDMLTGIREMYRLA